MTLKDFLKKGPWFQSIIFLLIGFFYQSYVYSYPESVSATASNQLVGPDEVELRIVDSVNCEFGIYFATIEMKAKEDTFQIGTSSIFLNYDRTVLQFTDYNSLAFDGSDNCIADVAPSWDEHGFDGVSVPGSFNLTIVLSTNEFSCPVLSADSWVKVGTICFNILRTDSNPLMSIDSTNTSFNRNSPNNGTGAIPLGTLTGIDKLINCASLPDNPGKSDSTDNQDTTVVPIDQGEDGILLRLLENEDCNTSDFCANLEIRANSDSFLIGTSSMLISYDPTLLTFENYSSSNFDENATCIGNQVSSWDEHAFDGQSVAGLFNLTLSLSAEEFSCPEISSDSWIEIGTIYFRQLSDSLRPTLIFDQRNTSFNRHLPNDGTEAIPIDSLIGIEGDQIITSIEEEQLANHIKQVVEVFPNPTDGRINIKLNQSSINVEYEIIDISGKRIDLGEIKNGSKELIVTDLPDGLYFIKIYIDNQFFVKKILKF